MPIKLGKYKNCVKRFRRFGLSQHEAELACARHLHQDEEWTVEDDEWEATMEKKKEKKKKTGFEVEKEKKKETGFEIEPREPVKPEEKAKRLQSIWKERTPAGGKGAGMKERGKARPVKTVPLSYQLPLFQPWRSLKSQHRLQTKLEKIQTKEEQYLTQEQLLKRSQYAVAIKKRDSGELEIILPAFITDEIVEDAGRKAGLGTLARGKGGGSGRRMAKKEGQEQWITTKTGKRVPITEPEGGQGTTGTQEEMPDIKGMFEKIFKARVEAKIEGILEQSEKEAGTMGKAKKAAGLKIKGMTEKQTGKLAKRLKALSVAKDITLVEQAMWKTKPPSEEEQAVHQVAEKRYKQLMEEKSRAPTKPEKTEAHEEWLEKMVSKAKEQELKEDVPIEKITEKELSEKSVLESIMAEFDKELEENPAVELDMGKLKMIDKPKSAHDKATNWVVENKIPYRTVKDRTIIDTSNNSYISIRKSSGGKTVIEESTDWDNDGNFTRRRMSLNQFIAEMGKF